VKGMKIDTYAKGIYYPALGLASILIASLMGISSAGFNVHSGEIFIWILGLLIFGMIVPLVLFVKSLEIVRYKSWPEKSKIKVYSIVLTYSLGIIIVGLLIFLLWTTIK
jgi:amino acid transporter